VELQFLQGENGSLRVLYVHKYLMFRAIIHLIVFFLAIFKNRVVISGRKSKLPLKNLKYY